MRLHHVRLAVPAALAFMLWPMPQALLAQHGIPEALDARDPQTLSVDEKNEFQRRVEIYLNEVEQWVAEANTKAKSYSQASKDELNSMLPRIQNALRDARAELEKLKFATGDEWEQQMKRLDQAVQNLKQIHYRALSRLRDDREKYERVIQSRLEQLDERLYDLSVRASTAAATVRIEIQKTRDELQKERQNVAAKLEQLRQAGADQWIMVRSELEDLLNRWEDRYKAAVARFRKPQALPEPVDGHRPERP